MNDENRDLVLPDSCRAPGRFAPNFGSILKETMTTAGGELQRLVLGGSDSLYAGRAMFEAVAYPPHTQPVRNTLPGTFMLLLP